VLSPHGRRFTSLYLALPLLLFVVLLQATVVARVRFLSASPHLLLTMIVSWSLLRGVDEGMLWGFLGGLAFDLVAGLPLGASALALMTICFLAGLGESNLFQGNVFLPAILIALATPIYGGVISLIQQIGGVAVDWQAVAFRIVLPELLLNLATIAVTYPLLRWLAYQVRGDRMEW
jgi:rod shape-determining protein MreD